MRAHSKMRKELAKTRAKSRLNDKTWMVLRKLNIRVRKIGDRPILAVIKKQLEIECIYVEDDSVSGVGFHEQEERRDVEGERWSAKMEQDKQ